MTTINIETLLTIFLATFILISITTKILSRKKANINVGKIISFIVSLIIGVVFFITFFSIFKNLVLEFYPPIFGFEIIFKVIISLIPAIIFISIFFSIFKSIFSKTKSKIENELKKEGLDPQTIDAFKTLGATPNMSYSKINELLFEKIKKINMDNRLTLKEKEDKIKEFDDAFDIITEYYKNKI